MLFTSAVFVCLFLPATLAGFFLLSRLSQKLAAAWLLLASLVFYGYWQIQYTALLLLSICGNFAVGTRISRSGQPKAKVWLYLGVSINLGLLAYFKYKNFFIENLELLLQSPIPHQHVILPIGISFFTFTQIAFLVDSYRRKASEYNFVHYGLFVTYFPHLIAGPILHHAQMMPQFRSAATYRWSTANVAAGLAIFALGLFKKVVLADGISPYADAVFGPADGGQGPDFFEAWTGAAAYTLQLYFDFSGYSDMAIGLSWLFNVRLPFNFDSPYRATSIIEFWRRWHISLSNFLRDYLYIALGGNRLGAARRYINLFATMLLGGLWHGAGWTFIFWGGLHGLYLTINHLWRARIGPQRRQWFEANAVARLAGWALTMLVVMVAWVFFRAESLPGALRIIGGMLGGAPGQAGHAMLWNAGLNLQTAWCWLAVLGFIAFCLPNSNWWGEKTLARCHASARTSAWCLGAALGAIALLVVLNAMRDASSAFIYFNF